MKWVQTLVEGKQVNICLQKRQLECGVACLAMILRTFREGKEYNQIYAIPKSSELKFGGKGVPVKQLFDYIKNYLTEDARLTADKDSEQKKRIFTGRLKRTTSDKPAILILKGHYVVCIGPSNSKGKFIVLDPRKKTAAIAWLSDAESGKVSIQSNLHGVVELEGIITTASNAPPRVPSSRSSRRSLGSAQ